MLRVELAPSSIRSVFTLQHAHGIEILMPRKFIRPDFSRALLTHHPIIRCPFTFDASKWLWMHPLVISIARRQEAFENFVSTMHFLLFAILTPALCHSNSDSRFRTHRFDRRALKTICVKSQVFLMNLVGSMRERLGWKCVGCAEFLRELYASCKVAVMWNRATFAGGCDGVENLPRLTRTRQFSRFFCPCSSLLCPN